MARLTEVEYGSPGAPDGVPVWGATALRAVRVRFGQAVRDADRLGLGQADDARGSDIIHDHTVRHVWVLDESGSSEENATAGPTPVFIEDVPVQVDTSLTYDYTRAADATGTAQLLHTEHGGRYFNADGTLSVGTYSVTTTTDLATGESTTQTTSTFPAYVPVSVSSDDVVHGFWYYLFHPWEGEGPGYSHYLFNPSDMDRNLEVGFWGSLTVAGGSLVAAGGGWASSAAAWLGFGGGSRLSAGPLLMLGSFGISSATQFTNSVHCSHSLGGAKSPPLPR